MPGPLENDAMSQSNLPHEPSLHLPTSPAANSAEELADLRALYANHGQSHVFAFWDELAQSQRLAFLRQLREIDLEQVQRLVEGAERTVDFAALARRSEGPRAVRGDGTGAPWSVPEARACGEQALRRGEVAILIVAGGQGTRLGFDAPKGMFPIGPLSHRTLFQIFADQIRALQRRYEQPIRLLLMTSPATDAATHQYFRQSQWLGLLPDKVSLFCQGTMPAVDASSGHLLLAEKDSLALSPDGHGGTVAALQRSGLLETLTREGVRYLFYAQVDNPLVALGDPALIGHHILAASEMTTQVVQKREPLEKVGNVVQVDGKVQIIEYSDLPADAAQQRQADGQLKLWAGNIAVHIFNLDFLRRVGADPEQLPFHRALKKVPAVDQTGKLVEPPTPNAIKFERFIFDLLPAAKNAFVVEGIQREVFAPVKNGDGAPSDTPAAAQQQLVDLHRQWLRRAGIEVPEAIRVEIHPLLAVDADDVLRAVQDGRLPPAGTRISCDTFFAPQE